MNSSHCGALTDVAGLRVGHCTHAQRLTGCSVVLAPDGAVAGVDVRGAAPGTRETDLLDPANLVDRVHAVVLAGGSAFGLDAASGVMRWLDEQGIGFPTAHGHIPIVPAAVLYDLALVRTGDNPRARPDAQCGYQAAQAASAQAGAEGNVGAGAGATVGKLFGPGRSMKAGIGQASVSLGPWTVGALIACNAVGDVIDPETGALLAGARSSDGRQRIDSRHALLQGQCPALPLAGANTTIGVIGTNARLSKAQAQRLAMSAHDGLARSVRPAHTPFDGDTLFALATGTHNAEPDMMLLTTLAAEACARAIVRAATQAQGVQTLGGFVPAVRDLPTC